MHFNTIAASAVLATASAAAVLPRQAPVPEPVAPNTAFQLLSLHSGSDVHFQYVSAANNSLWLKLADQKAACDKTSDGLAQFRLVDDGLFLYRTSYSQQQIWTDRSGMGQGITGYTTGVQPVPSRNGERGPFVLDQYNTLTLNGTSFLACPETDGAYRLWTGAGASEPAGSKGCLGVSLRAVPVSQPNGCLYTDAPVRSA
ncbi:hypothetical protein RB595_005687 [Gaeumannomyces hyphopodioides]